MNEMARSASQCHINHLTTICLASILEQPIGFTEGTEVNPHRHEHIGAPLSHSKYSKYSTDPMNQ